MTWHTLPAVFRTLGRWLTIVQLVGYTTSLAFVAHTSHLTPAGAAERYRGNADGGANEGAGEMTFPKSYDEMLTITHTHLLGMAAIFAFSGLGLALCRRPSERVRRWLIAEPFAAVLVSFASIWGMRYADPRFGWLLMVSSGLMALTFYAQAFLVLRELGFVEREAAAA